VKTKDWTSRAEDAVVAFQSVCTHQCGDKGAKEEHEVLHDVGNLAADAQLRIQHPPTHKRAQHTSGPTTLTREPKPQRAIHTAGTA
jgi:hypothetical protein